VLKLDKDQAAKLGGLVRSDGKMSAADFQRVVHGRSAPVPHTAEPVAPKRGKYASERIERDGQRFDSRLEADVYDALRARGALFLRQVPFHLPGGGTYRLDFLEILDPAAVRLLDPKGVETEMFRTKRRLVEELYRPLTIETITRADLREGRFR
jgi:hypothetical protein